MSALPPVPNHPFLQTAPSWAQLSGEMFGDSDDKGFILEPRPVENDGPQG